MYLAILIATLVCLFVSILINLRNSFKIGYYETRLKIRGVDISEVENMPWYKLWLS